jgi:hypothetical protein
MAGDKAQPKRCSITWDPESARNVGRAGSYISGAVEHSEFGLPQPPAARSNLSDKKSFRNALVFAKPGRKSRKQARAKHAFHRLIPVSVIADRYARRVGVAAAREIKRIPAARPPIEESIFRPAGISPQIQSNPGIRHRSRASPLVCFNTPDQVRRSPSEYPPR